MNNDIYYNLFDKEDNKDISLKLNIDELYIKKQEHDLNILNNYNKILNRIHSKIKITSKQLVNEQCCWYIIPEILLGVSKYNNKDCCVYVIEKLRENGFIVRYTHPNLLFISWKHWVPSYVRNEIKKKTGKTIDEYGNIINNENYNSNDIEKEQKNIDNLILNNKNKNIEIENKKLDFKDIKSYKPSGNLIYSNNLLKKLNLNEL